MEDLPLSEYKLCRRGRLIGLLAVGWVVMVIGFALLMATLGGQWLSAIIIGVTFGFGLFSTLILDQRRRRRELFDAGDGRSK